MYMKITSNIKQHYTIKMDIIIIYDLCPNSTASNSGSIRGCPRGVIVKAMDCGIVALLCSLSGKYPCERCEPLYPPSYGLNSTTTVFLGEWLWH